MSNLVEAPATGSPFRVSGALSDGRTDTGISGANWCPPNWQSSELAFQAFEIYTAELYLVNYPWPFH